MPRLRSRLLPSFAVLAVAAAACAPMQRSAQAQPSQSPAPQAGRQCFSALNVNNFAPVDDTHVNLRVGASDIYQLTLFAPCRDINWSWALGVRTRSGGSFICTGLDAEIIVPDRNFPQRCLVTAIRKLSPAEVAAAPPRQQP